MSVLAVLPPSWTERAGRFVLCDFAAEAENATAVPATAKPWNHVNLLNQQPIPLPLETLFPV